jgi:type II secretory pathway component PulF
MARIGTGALAQLCHRVGNSLHAGVDVRRVWESEARRGSTRQRTEMEDMRQRIAKGETMSTAFRQANGYFPPLLCEMVEVGERTGRLEEVFLRLGEHYDRILQLRRNFLIGIAWPVFELGLALLVIGVLILLLGEIGASWDGEPMSVMGLYGRKGLLIYIGILASIGGCIGLVVTAVRQGWMNTDLIYRVLMHLPGIGIVLRTMAMSRLIWSLAIATDSDLSAQRSVELAVRSTQSSYYTSCLPQMRDILRRGESLHSAFEATGIYPRDFLDALDTGEVAGRVSETMLTLAKQYEERTKALYKTLAVVAGIVVLLLVFGIIIFFIIQTFTNLYLKPIQDTLRDM